jgi:hypothetical protein
MDQIRASKLRENNRNKIRAPTQARKLMAYPIKKEELKNGKNIRRAKITVRETQRNAKIKSSKMCKYIPTNLKNLRLL